MFLLMRLKMMTTKELKNLSRSSLRQKRPIQARLKVPYPLALQWHIERKAERQTLIKRIG